MHASIEAYHLDVHELRVQIEPSGRHGHPQVHQIARRIRRVRPSHAPIHVADIELVDVHSDTTRKRITWTRAAPPIPPTGP